MKTPKYLQIERELRREIEDGSFEPGDLFYSNVELIERFGASSITVIHAVRDLVNDGLLVRYQGKGTFVSRSRHRRLVRLSEHELFHGDEADETRVLRLERIPLDERDPSVVEKLQLPAGDSYAVIERVRSYEGVPYQHQESYIPVRYIRDHVQPSYYESVYRRFREDFGIQLAREASHEEMRIVLPATPHVREALHLSEGDPCVYKERTTTLSDGTIAEFIKMHKRWDYFEQTVEEAAS